MRKFLLSLSLAAMGFACSESAVAQTQVTNGWSDFGFTAEKTTAYVAFKAGQNDYTGYYSFGSGRTSNFEGKAGLFVMEVVDADSKTYYLKKVSNNNYLKKPTAASTAFAWISESDAVTDRAVLTFSDASIIGDAGNIALTDLNTEAQAGAYRINATVNNEGTTNTFVNFNSFNWASGMWKRSAAIIYTLTDEQVSYLDYSSLDVPANAPAGALGSSTFNTEYPEVSAKIAQLKSSVQTLPYGEIPADLPTLEELQSAISNASTISTTITDGGLYRLYNNMYPTYMMTANVNGATALDGITDDKIDNIVQLNAVEGEEGKYYVKLQGKGINVAYADGGAGGAATLVEGNGHIFEVANDGAHFTLGDADYTNSNGRKYLHMSDSKDMVGWDSDADASKWYIVPVTEVEVALNAAADGKSYASLALPFDAEVSTADVTVYQGENKNSYVTMAEVGNAIPAGEGVLLVSESANSVTLNVATPATSEVDFNNNCLEATFAPMSGASNAIYIFGQKNDVVGFYTLSETGSLAANRAYISKPEAGAPALTLNFGGEATGIESIEAANGENAVYDLSGRLVTNPAKGIYIVGGKKVYVK